MGPRLGCENTEPSFLPGVCGILRGDFAQRCRCRTDMQECGDFIQGRQCHTDMQEGGDFAHGRQWRTDMQVVGDVAHGRRQRTERSRPATPTLRGAAPQAAQELREGSFGVAGFLKKSSH
jgi:hypothetical protein